MDIAIQQSKKALKNNEVPVGAVLVNCNTGKIIAKNYNQVEKKYNCLYHAEILVISEACKILKSKYLFDYELYVTLEPCMMCCAYIAQAKIKRLYYSVTNEKYGAVESNLQFFNKSYCFHKPEIYNVIMEANYKQLLKSFFFNIRKTIY